MKLRALVLGISFVVSGLTVPVAVWGQQAGGDVAEVAPEQAPIPVADQATREQILKYFEVTHVRKTVNGLMKMMPSMMEQALKTQFDQNKAASAMSEEQRKALLEKFSQQFTPEFMKAYDDLLNDMIPVYQRHISKSDADAVIAFYSSGPGQRILEEQPIITKEAMPILMNGFIAKVQAIAAKAGKEVAAQAATSNTKPDTEK